MALKRVDNSSFQSVYAFTLDEIEKSFPDTGSQCSLDEYLSHISDALEFDFMYYNDDVRGFDYSSHRLLPQHLEAVRNNCPFSVMLGDNKTVYNLVYSERLGILVSLGRRQKKSLSGKQEFSFGVFIRKRKQNSCNRKGSVSSVNPDFKPPRMRVLYNNMGHGKKR